MTTPRRAQHDKSNTATQLAELSSEIVVMRTAFTDFAEAVKKQSERDADEKLRIWDAIKEQGDSLKAAIDTLSSRGAIRLPTVLTLLGTIVVICGFFGNIFRDLVEERLKSLETVDTYSQKLMDEKLKTQEVENRWLRERGYENHESIRELNGWRNRLGSYK